MQYTGTDSLDKNFVVLSRYMPLQIKQFSEFTSQNPKFLLYEEDPGMGFDWLPSYLARTALMEALVVQPSQKVYLVTMK